MNKLILATTIALLFAGALSAAAGGVIRTKDGRSEPAYDIQAETVAGIYWQKERNVPGTRVKLWELDNVRYNGQAMDEYNGLARKLAGGLSSRLIADAKATLEMEAPSGFDKGAWARIQLSCKYYLAMGEYLQENWGGAKTALEDYITECEKPESLYDNSVRAAAFNSKVTGNKVNNAGGLNRFYLDALETLGLTYLKQGDAKNAVEKAFNPLQELAEVLSKSSVGDKEFYDWGIRALRASAHFAESQKDYAGAREAWDSLQKLALSKQGGQPSRASYEALLKVGFMEILQGKTRDAHARFYNAIREWNAGHATSRPAPPRSDWISPDIAYLTAGSFVGQGLVQAAEAKNKEDWAESLESFSTSLAIFNADDEIRSMALLGAARASAKLAELNKSAATVASTYAKLADKYLSELTQLLPKSNAASDKSLPEIQKIINTYKGE